MKQSLLTYSIQLLFMLAIITKAFGLSSPPEQHPMMPRQFDLSGNIVYFSMPENFSQDMPADDMIESVNLRDKNVYEDPHQFTLIRRWRDFKDRGFFAKEYGTIMMSLYLKEVPDILNIDTIKPLNFIDIIIDDIKKNKPDDSENLAVYSDYFTAYDEKFYGTLRWLRYVQGPLDGTQYSILFAIPITEKQYIVAEFTSSPNNDIDIRGFVDNYTESFIDKIMNSFGIDYVDNNPVKQAVIKSEAPSL